jgi:hypothetical protein
MSVLRRVLIGVLILVLTTLYASLLMKPTRLLLEAERHARLVSDLRALKCELDSVRLRSGSFPSSLGALQYLPRDPWGRDYVYRYPGTLNRNGYDLFSAGSDGRPNTPDDDWGGE